ncbi:MAG: transketolase [Fusobacteriaceae bacterium]|jgi:transketolase|nr:transketolase [Fusobacteriaceae bacterium]
MSNIKSLEKKATELRKDIVTMICKSKSGHPGGSLSVIDILTALYYDVMNIDVANPKKEDRDRFVLSKGHAAPALYAVLADKGYINKELLGTLRQFGSPLQGHPDMKKVSGVEISTGSLGQGLSVANGMALASRLQNIPYRVYVAMGDGELQEGQVWEAAMTSAQYKLDNLTAFVDYNNLQIDGNVSDIMDVASVEDKFKAFGWNVLTIDGHNFQEILDAVEKAKECKGKPTMIVANTIKGKGVDFMENVCGFHGVAPTEEETKRAIEQLEKTSSI